MSTISTTIHPGFMYGLPQGMPAFTPASDFGGLVVAIAAHEDNAANAWYNANPAENTPDRDTP